MASMSSVDLALARQSKGLTLDQIANDTKIRTYYLAAIEQGRIERLPEGVYRASYIRQYARAIAYDEAELLDRYSAALP